jgi:hypothetical protein
VGVFTFGYNLRLSLDIVFYNFGYISECSPLGIAGAAFVAAVAVGWRKILLPAPWKRLLKAGGSGARQ